MFSEEKFEDETMQKCWLILGKIYYNYWVTDFLEPVTADLFGDEMFADYCRIVTEPMDISTMIGKMKGDAYKGDKEEFKRDMMLIFDNCRKFNQNGTEIVACANALTLEFHKLWVEYELN